MRPLQAQNSGDDYEEILVYLKVLGVGGYDINSIFSYNDNRLLLPVTELFTTLRINQETSDRYDTVSGYLLNEQKKYIISYPGMYIAVNGDTTRLKENDILKTKFGLFLYTGIFGKAFGLYCNFNFRALSVDLKTDLELPAIRDMRLAQMRKNIEMIKGEVSVDTIIPREYHWLRFGMLDWAINSTQSSGHTTNTRLSTAIGAEVLGGETNAILNYSTNNDFDLRNQQFSWRWANNKSKYIRQVTAGKLSPGSISSVYDPFYGIMVTNSPTTYRRSFGEYELTGYTEPGWTVELYINNVLIDYKKADASGFYSFNVPLVYGSSEVVVKLYGPYGEERVREEPISIPYNFLPKGDLEYMIRGGMVDDTMQSSFARAEASYGVNRFLTLGGGYEYYSFLRGNNEIPFVSASVSPAPNLLITGEYADKVRAQTLLSYRLSSNATFEVNYARYEPGQEAIRFNYLEERRITVSVPVKFLFFNGYTRLGFKQNVYESFNYNTAEFLISSNIGPVNVNLTSYANWTSGIDPFFNTNLSASMRLGRGYTARSQAQIDINGPSVISYKAELEKRISRQGYASVNYEENLRANTRSVNVAFRYDLPFGQTSVSSRFSDQGMQTTQGVQGSLAFGSGNNYVHADNRSVTGRGGLTLIPFLDINFNNHKDDNEPVIPNLDVRINGGRFLNREKDSLTRVMDLEPYTSYLIELNNDGFDNIAWQLRDKAIRVYIDPNQFKKVEIPVYPMGEVNGMVYIKTGNKLTGQGRILVNIYNEEGRKIKKLMSERDGYFTFLGLAPGNYHAMLDSVQMERLAWSYEPVTIDFTIQPSEWGDIVDGVDFTIIRDDGADAMPTSRKNSKPDHQQKINKVRLHEKPKENNSKENITKKILNNQKDAIGTVENAGHYFVQVASCPTLPIAEKQLSTIKKIAGFPADIYKMEGKYKVRFGYFNSRELAQDFLNEISDNDIDGFIGSDNTELPKVVRIIKPETDTSNTKNEPSNTKKIASTSNFDRSRGKYYVQSAAFKSKDDAQSYMKSIEPSTDCPAGVVRIDGLFKVRFGYFQNREDAQQCLDQLKANGIEGYIGTASQINDTKPQPEEPVNIEENTTTQASAFDPDNGKYYVQAASCPTRKIADGIIEKLPQIDFTPGIVEMEGHFKVRFGYFQNRENALKCLEQLKAAGAAAYIGIEN